MISETPQNYNQFIDIIDQYGSVCFYLSTKDCNVCKILKPKIIDLLKNCFPKINFCYVDVELSKEIAGQLSVFSVPTIIFYFDGKETIRVSRNVNLEELKLQIERFYDLFFEKES